MARRCSFVSQIDTLGLERWLPLAQGSPKTALSAHRCFVPRQVTASGYRIQSIDSYGFLNFVIALDKDLEGDIRQADYGELNPVNKLVRYVSALALRQCGHGIGGVLDHRFHGGFFRARRPSPRRAAKPFAAGIAGRAGRRRGSARVHHGR